MPSSPMDIRDNHKGIRIRGATIRIKEFKSDIGFPEYRIVFELPNKKQLELSNVSNTFISFNTLVEGLIENSTNRKPKYKTITNTSTYSWQNTQKEKETIIESGIPILIEKDMKKEKPIIDISQTIDPLSQKLEEIKAEKVNKDEKIEIEAGATD